MQEYRYRVNDGAEQTITIKSTQYNVAAAAVLAFVGNDEMMRGIKIEIWVPSMLPEYGPYRYAAHYNQFGNIEIGVLASEQGDARPLQIPIP